MNEKDKIRLSLDASGWSVFTENEAGQRHVMTSNNITIEDALRATRQSLQRPVWIAIETPPE